MILPLHEADIADLLEALPLDRRRAAWSVLPPERTGAVLVEASESVAENLLEEISEAALARGFAGMDINDVARPFARGDSADKSPADATRRTRRPSRIAREFVL